MRHLSFPNLQDLQAQLFPIHDNIKTLILKKWNDLDHLTIPRLMQKMFILEHAGSFLPHNVKIDSVLANLAGKTLVSLEDCTSSDTVDKKTESALKSTYAALNLSVCMGIYAAYKAQSLVKGFNNLAAVTQEGKDCSDMLATMELQAR